MLIPLRRQNFRARGNYWSQVECGNLQNRDFPNCWTDEGTKLPTLEFLCQWSSFNNISNTTVSFLMLTWHLISHTSCRNFAPAINMNNLCWDHVSCLQRRVRCRANRWGGNPEEGLSTAWAHPHRPLNDSQLCRHEVLVDLSCIATVLDKRQVNTIPELLVAHSTPNVFVHFKSTTEIKLLEDAAGDTPQTDFKLQVPERSHLEAAVKPVVHSFMEAGRSSGDQQCEEEKEEPDEQSGEEEEHCLPLEETMAASWIAQIGEGGLSETEAVDSFIAMNEQRKRTWAQAQELKKAARKDRGFFSSRTAARNRGDGCRQLRQFKRRSSTSMDSDGTSKDARLRKESRCFRCKKKGHWKAECPEKQHNVDGTAPAVFSGLTFLHTVDEESVWSAATWGGQSDEDAAWAKGSSGIPPGHLIVDSAAGQAFIGEAACVRWEHKLSDAGLRGV